MLQQRLHVDKHRPTEELASRQASVDLDALVKENKALRDQLAQGRLTAARTSIERSSYEASAGLLQNELQQFLYLKFMVIFWTKKMQALN